jgi:hypothetical protein
MLDGAPSWIQERILEQVDKTVGFDALNTLAKGAVLGAGRCKFLPEVLQAVVGNPAPLAAMWGRKTLGNALRGAAAGGHMAPLESLLARRMIPGSVSGTMQTMGRGEVAVDATDHTGQTALMIASEGGHAGAVKALLAAGATVNAKDNRGYTALMHACPHGHTMAVEALLAAGADADAKNSEGNTPLAFAEEALIRARSPPEGAADAHAHEHVARLLRKTTREHQYYLHTVHLARSEGANYQLYRDRTRKRGNR